ncbi:angiogenic factor with G patch and FHA domains 1, partial [Biomphalaria pfeifferi]
MEELALCRSTNSNIIPDNITLTKSASNISDLLEQKKLEIEHLKKQLIKTERLLEKANHYNEDLRKELETLSAKIHETRKNSPIDVATQVTEAVIEEAYGNKPMPEWIVSSSDKSSSLSIAETVKATIEAELECLSNAGKSSSEKECPKESSTEETQEYIYDSTSGCYYHPATGYYWDSNQRLFYDYTTGTYYQYDEHAKQYKVHSVIDSTGQYQQFGSNQDGSHCLVKSDMSKSGEGAKIIKKQRTRRKKRSSNKMSEKLKTDVIMISDSDDEDVDYIRKMGESNPENEAKQIENSSLESDESSGSLATGESELESGEITDDSSCSDIIMDPIVSNDQSTVEQLSDSLTEIADNYPPCIRVIVEASEHLPLGSLYIITCAGGSIGREQNLRHSIEICDSNISKIHAEVSYDYENSCYVLIDKGSQNGTFLNSKRMSKSKCTSENHKLAHGDVVEIGSTKLLLHIHKGHETCEECEPGQVQAKIKAQNPIKNDYVLLSKEEKNRLRRNQLKNIKKKYGLQNTHFENPGAVLPGSDYCDKAYLRRKYIGSESNATGQDDTPASVQSPISTENKGHKLLAKMGWKEGEGLGKSNSGIAEP